MADDEIMQVVEGVATIFQGAGLSPIAGRVLGWLLVCEPADQTAAELAHVLHASTGSISTQTTMLTHMGFIERTRRRGSRANFYRLRPHVWTSMIEAEVERSRQLRELSAHAMVVKKAAGQSVDHRLREFHEFAEFFEEKFPALVQEWRTLREESK